jgi:hypothetical protein
MSHCLSPRVQIAASQKWLQLIAPLLLADTAFELNRTGVKYSLKHFVGFVGSIRKIESRKPCEAPALCDGFN